ncbi:MAG: hypothetical protein KatS3mg031_0880 [Chitinophagales bacterium]|nr:MAG: hypothetical protein KatS3mg031_0880 [Chitinophagales bacterium]
MKNLFPLACFLLGMAACSNELDIAADYREIPVIYGLLNDAENTHYIQVLRGFMDDKSNALRIARNPDSLFYSESVVLKVERNGQPVTISRIDAATIGLARQPGVFIDSPNYVYTFQENLLENHTYRLTFTNQETGTTVTAETRIVKDFDITYPLTALEVNLVKDLNITWNAAENGKIYQLLFRFHFLQWKADDPLNKDTLFADIPIFNGLTSSGTTGGERMNFNLEGNAFFSSLRNALTVDQNIRRRALDAPLELIFYVGSEELFNYISINSVQSGITSLQVKPEYTNIQGGLGIFGSRLVKSVKGYRLTNASLDSLSCGQYTRALYFTNWSCN